MKKLSLVLIILSLILASGGVILAEKEDQQYERIPSPDQIKNFRAIKNGNGVLYGIRKEIKSEKKEERKLEKINHPKEISLFEKIKKIGSTLWGFRKEDKKENNQKENALKFIYIKPEASQCVKDAINKKDTALKVANTDAFQRQSTAIDTRGECQKMALTKTAAQEQFDANKACIDEFKTNMKTSKETTEQDKKDARDTYNANLKACSVLQTAPVATSTTETIPTEEIKVDDGENEGESEM